MHASIPTGTLASFVVGDVLCPDAGEALRSAGPELAVTGRILYFSDRGTDRDRFAIIEVEGIHTPLIVPVDRLRFGVDRTTTQAMTASAGRGAQHVSHAPAN